MLLRSCLKQSPLLQQIVSKQAAPLKAGPPFTAIETVQILQGVLKYLNFGTNFQRTFHGGTPDGKFGRETTEAVKAFQATAFPKQPGEWDGIVGGNTISALDGVLPVVTDPPPRPSIITGPTDIIIYVSGKADDTGFGGKELGPGDATEFDDILAIPPRKNFNIVKRGFGGSLQNTSFLQPALDTIFALQQQGNGGRTILYGYSAGAMQLMGLCDVLEAKNSFPNINFLTKLFFSVDLLITVDAANGLFSGFMPRIVSGCVVRNVNYFQTSRSRGGSFGGANMGLSGAALRLPVIQNKKMDAQLQATSSTQRHYEINTLVHPMAMAEIRAALA